MESSTEEQVEKETVDDGKVTGASRAISIIGSGGDGVALLGNLLLTMAAKQGLYGIMVQSYGPQIRGGESAVVLRISATEVQYEGDQIDLLLCFRLGDLERFQGSVKLSDSGTVILDAAEKAEVPEWLGHGGTSYRYPFSRVENGIEVPGEPRNMMGMALLCRALGWQQELARDVLTTRFGHRPDVLKRNLDAFDRAWGVATTPELAGPSGSPRSLVAETGNEAIARGAMAAGLRFFAGYPITPSSEIMETLIRELPAVGGKIVQAEDEIAAMGMVLGASFGGVPAMTATSGPGLSLMTEMIGLSSMTEIPAVIVDCQRAGPATGMPSRTEQADLFHAIYAGHGDFPRVVLGVFDVVHAHDVMFKAFHLSETYQLPVLVLSDAYIAQRRQIRDPVTETPAVPRRARWKEGDGEARFEAPEGGVVAPFRVPGTPGGAYLAAGIEHTLHGDPTADTAIHQAMSAKRFKKLDAVARESRDWFRALGEDTARNGIVAWGSQYGLLREWLAEHREFRAFLPEIILPFPLEAFVQWRRGLDWMAVVELSFQGQFHHYLSSLTDMREAHSLCRSGGIPLTGTELSRLIAEVAR